jgi:hypothetical protein
MAFSFFLRDLDDVARTELSTQVALYKRIRPILLDSASIVLGPQPVSFPDRAWSGWDVVEHVSRRTGDAVILAFDMPITRRAPWCIRRPFGRMRYDVESADYGTWIVLRAALMAQGEVPPRHLTRSRADPARAGAGVEKTPGVVVSFWKTTPGVLSLAP